MKAVYKLLPSSVQPVDARHLLARYTRLSRVLLRADVLAERLAGRALTVRLQSPLIPAKAGTSEPPFSQPFNNPLYLRALHSWLAPEPLWESAAEAEDERGDLTALHLMAAESLTSAGLPPGPDPRLRLPRFELWQPPPPPEIHLL
ncbi:MAG: hypothetical protein CMK07_09675 [Ponticaulis sp.]|nr:hypothetical protein [Ponticaulis sp.]